MDPGKKNDCSKVVPLHPRAVADPPGLARAGDDDLMLLARGGVREAFGLLIDRHQPAILRFAARQLGNAEGARDAAQNTFLSLYRSLPSYRARGRFRAFLFGIALSQCRLIRRSFARASRARVRLTGQPLEPVALPSDAILRQERLRELQRALAGLGRRHREVVELRFAGGLSHEEIADVLDIPVGTVKSRLFTGLARLHDELKGERS